MSQLYTGIIDRVERYFRTNLPPPLILTNKDLVVGLTIKNESCNYLLYVMSSEQGLEENQMKVAEIIMPGLYFHRSYNHPRLVNACYTFKYVEVPDEAKLRDCDKKILAPFRQMSITYETINCK